MAEQSQASKRPIKKLRPHQKQAEFFRDLPDAEIQALAEDMRQNGQRDPVHITQDGVILAGHQRVRAAKMLGWKEIQVVVRHDLDNAQAEALLVSDNLVRRHLGPLEKARCMQRLVELEQDCEPGQLSERGTELVKQRVAEQLSISPRNLNRYLLALRAPTGVQRAFEIGEISLVDAGRVALLEEDVQESVAERIENGESAKAVVVGAIHRRPPSQSAHTVLDRFAEMMARKSSELRSLLGQLRPHQIAKNSARLSSGRSLLDELLRRAKLSDDDEEPDTMSE